jgi:K+ transporter
MNKNPQLARVTLGAIGVVFGDIGTSPLYALKEVFHSGMPIDQFHVLGVLSLIFWSLMLVVTLKYALFIMRADNKGEGGIMALMALALHGSGDNPRKMAFITTIGLLGASLFYGDSIITPAISVLSAVEGLQIIAPPLAEFVLPIAITVLAYIVIQAIWQWNKTASIIFLSLFLVIDFLFLTSNSLKIPTGGWLPLAVAAVLFLVITTWLKGRALLQAYMEEKHVLFEELEKDLTDKLVTVEGTAIYLARTLRGVPQVLLHNLAHNRALHEQIIVLTIDTTEEPYVDEAHRVKIRKFSQSREFYRVKLYYGFKQNADVRRALDLLIREGLVFDPKKVAFFIGSERINFRMRSPMPPWRRGLFRFFFHNASSPIEFFKIPVDNVVELGIRIEL